MSEKTRTITVEVLEELRRFNERGARHIVDAILEDHVNWKNPYGSQVYLDDVKAELREQRSVMARKGGCRPKRRDWAEQLGEELAGTPSKEQAWDTIPEAEEEGYLIEAGGRSYFIDKDGNKLYARDDATGVADSIAKSTFLKRYLKLKR